MSNLNSPTASDVAKDAVPSAALMQLLSPDGYYVYLGIEKPSTNEIDEELVKKNYRRLSLKHHPDRRGGDDETFRVLNRAQRVLLHSKLRQQYDILGMDLDDEDHKEDDDHHHHQDDPKEGEEQPPPPATADTIVAHMASATLAGILQAVVRTVMMGIVAVLLVRYRITVFPTVAFLAFMAYRVRSSPGGGNTEMLSPFLIAVGLLLMNQGRTFPETTWSVTFWIGEAMVMTMFSNNSLPPQTTPYLFLGIAAASFALSLWLRGDPWKYVTLVAVELFLAIVVALLFPIMEMILEEILKEKLRKVGDKIRHHAKLMEVYYESKQ